MRNETCRTKGEVRPDFRNETTNIRHRQVKGKRERKRETGVKTSSAEDAMEGVWLGAEVGGANKHNEGMEVREKSTYIFNPLQTKKIELVKNQKMSIKKMFCSHLSDKKNN